MMADSWRKTTVGEQLTLQRGFDITKAEQRRGTVPVVSSGGIKSFHDTVAVEGPGVVLGRKGRVGTVYFVPRGFWPHDTSLWVRDFKSNDPRFVYYFFLSIRDVLESLDHGTANPTLNRNHVHPLSVRWPPPEEQRAIAGILGALDDKIELNREMNRTLEATAQAIFRSWFVDFEPVVAKADGRRPFGMTDDLAALFPDRFVESELGSIPDGWEWRPVSKALQVNPKRDLDKGQKAPYLAMASTPTHSAIPTEWGERDYGSGVRFRAGDILLAKITPCLENGKTAYVGFLGEEEVGWGSTEFIVLAARGAMPPEFPYYLARSEEFRTHAIANMTGSSGRQRVPVSALKHFNVAIPSDGVFTAFGRISGPTMKKLVQNVEESQTLSDLREFLLPKLFSGEIRVSEAEDAVEAVV